MTQYNGSQNASTDTNNIFSGGCVRAITDTIVYASQAYSSGTIVFGGIKIPQGALVLGIVLNTDTSTSTATLEFGTSTTAGLFSAAAAYTSTNAPTLIGKQGGAGGLVMPADAYLLCTLGTANLPASGNLTVTVLYVTLS